MSASIYSIAPHKGLQPETRRFDGLEDDYLNVDAIITFMQSVDTPEAKRNIRIYRRRLAKIEANDGGLPPKKQREKAFIETLEEIGEKVNFVDLDAGKRG